MHCESCQLRIAEVTVTFISGEVFTVCRLCAQVLSPHLVKAVKKIGVVE
jgi:protein-arginine kinase activator protein McsA